MINLTINQYFCRFVATFFEEHWLIVSVTTAIFLTIQVLFAVRMITAKKASDMVPHLALQMIAFIVWASTGTTTGILILYEILFHGNNNNSTLNNTLDNSAIHFPDGNTSTPASSQPKTAFLMWGIASGTMLLISGLVLYFFLVVQTALAEISGRRDRSVI